MALQKTALILLLSLPGLAYSQQNLINVPSSDITLKSRPFFQQQVNFVNNGNIVLNSTFCWGLGKEMEIGFNILGVYLGRSNSGYRFQSNSDPSDPPLYPFYMANFQKAWKLNKTFKVAMGTQAGFSVGMHFGGYVYGNIVTALPKIHSKLITGLNHSSETFFGPGYLNALFPSARGGIQLGLETELIREKLLFMAEHISGSHSLGVSVVGLAFHLSDHWVASAGYQFSNQGNQSPNSTVIEFTYVPSVITHRRLFHEGHPEVEK